MVFTYVLTCKISYDDDNLFLYSSSQRQNRNKNDNGVELYKKLRERRGSPGFGACGDECCDCIEFISIDSIRNVMEGLKECCICGYVESCLKGNQCEDCKKYYCQKHCEDIMVINENNELKPFDQSLNINTVLFCGCKQGIKQDFRENRENHDHDQLKKMFNIYQSEYPDFNQYS